MADVLNPQKWIQTVLNNQFPGEVFKDTQRKMPKQWILHNVTAGSRPMRNILGGNEGVVVHVNIKSYASTSVDAYERARLALLAIERATEREEIHHGLVPIESDTRSFPSERYKPNSADTLLGYQYDCNFQLKFLFNENI